jgi:Tfp pilus assembly protein PilN
MSAIAMHDIDLIPADYRRGRALHRTLRSCGIVIGALVGAAAVTAGALRQAVSVTRAEIAELDKSVAMAEQQQAAIDALTEQKRALESEAVLRSGLRAGAPIDDFLTSIGSAAVDAGVWFRSWRFERLGAVVSAAPAGTESFFVVDANAAGAGVRSRILIVGRAGDVAGVSALVQAVATDGQFASVQVQRVWRDAAENVVQFELALSADFAGEAP